MSTKNSLSCGAGGRATLPLMNDESGDGTGSGSAARSIELTNQELSSIEQFRRQRQTSVLVILFTDIKGFTSLTERRGDRHALELLQHHDRILVGAIEEGGGGLVVKHIGDSVMAVFSEPSTAVERALRIQERIRAFNAEHPDEEPLAVRIGLHMGQVAVENQTQLDLFGRHVNRASRVEGLADAGQIYLTYPVFDSARGWLASEAAGALTWKAHGSYLLKGIPEAVAIYEVIDSRHGTPRPPRAGRRTRSLLPLWAALAVLAAGAAIALGATQIQRTQVWFEGWTTDVETIVDQKEKLQLEGEPVMQQRKSMTRLSPGRHLLRQDIHWQVKNYMELVVRRGKNVVKPNFTAAWLPDLEKRLDWEPGTRSVQGHEQFTYTLYDAKSVRSDHAAAVDLAVSGVENPSDRRRMTFTVEWKVVRDGTTISASSLVADIDTTSDETVHHEQILWEDGAHYWFLRYYASRTSLDAELGAAYIEYKD
jgi:class 3 adenylate cyclase